MLHRRRKWGRRGRGRGPNNLASRRFWSRGFLDTRFLRFVTQTVKFQIVSITQRAVNISLIQ